MEEFKYEGNSVIPQFTTYQDNGRLALTLLDTEYMELYAVLTVNIHDNLSNERCAFLDTNNCGDYVVSWLETHNFGKWTGRWGLSGFCSYPEFEFNQEIIDKYNIKKEFEFEELEV